MLAEGGLQELVVDLQGEPNLVSPRSGHERDDGERQDERGEPRLHLIPSYARFQALRPRLAGACRLRRATGSAVEASAPEHPLRPPQAGALVVEVARPEDNGLAR